MKTSWITLNKLPQPELSLTINEQCALGKARFSTANASQRCLNFQQILNAVMELAVIIFW